MYLLFADYIAFASKVLGREPRYYPNIKGIAPQSDLNYSMNLYSDLWEDNYYRYGDFYVNQTKIARDNTISSTSEDVGDAQNTLQFKVENDSRSMARDMASSPNSVISAISTADSVSEMLVNGSNDENPTLMVAMTSHQIKV
ncbi:hypothetical protein IWW48_006112 [Coemansia sp. RSA 1200]|nr:hypothetical protein IWW48_006112 [Coemansia sp. RSA 1200]